MPIIPVYQQPTVSLAPLRPSGMNVQAPIEAFGGQVGNTLGHLAGQVSEDIARAKAQAENDKAEDTFTKLSEWKIQKWNEASQKQGENALNVHDDYLKQYDDQAKEFESGMTPGVADKFRRAAARGRLAFSEELMHHQTRQASELQKTIAETGFQTMMDSAAVTPIHDAAVMYANRAGALASQEAERQGLTGDAKDVFVKEWRGRVLAAHIEATMKVDPYKATALYQEHKDEFTGKDAAMLKKYVDGQTMANQVMVQGERISSLPEDKQLAEVDKVSGGKPEFREALRAEVLHRVQAEKTLQQVAEDEAIGQVNEMLYALKPGSNRLSWAQMTKTDVWSNPALDGGDTRKRIRDQYTENIRRQSEGRPVDRVAQAIAYDDLMRNPRFQDGTMSPVEVSARAPKLGGYFDDALAKLRDTQQRIAAGDRKLDDVTIPDGFLDKTMEAYGYTSVGKKGKDREDYFAMRGDIMVACQREIISESKRQKRRLTQAEEQEIVRKEVRTVKLANGGEKPLGLVKDVSELVAPITAGRGLLSHILPWSTQEEIAQDEARAVNRMWKEYQAASLASGEIPPEKMSPEDAQMLLETYRKDKAKKAGK